MSSRGCPSQNSSSARRRVSFSGSPPREPSANPGTSRLSCQSRRSNIPQPVSRSSRFLGSQRSHPRCAGACSTRQAGVVAVPVQPAPYQDEVAALPPDAGIACVAQVVQERLLMQEREEYETLQRNLTGMQQFRRNYVMAALRDNEDYVVANLNEVMNASQQPHFEYRESFAPLDAEQPPSGFSCSGDGTGSEPSELGILEEGEMDDNIYPPDESSSFSIQAFDFAPDFWPFGDSSEADSGYASGSCSDAGSLPPEGPAVAPDVAQAVIQAAAQVVGVPNMALEDPDYQDFVAGLAQCPTSSFIK